jgi:hypothetical protein
MRTVAIDHQVADTVGWHVQARRFAGELAWLGSVRPRRSSASPSATASYGPCTAAPVVRESEPQGDLLGVGQEVLSDPLPDRLQRRPLALQRNGGRLPRPVRVEINPEVCT